MRPLRALLGALVALVVAGALASPAEAGTRLHGRQTGPATSRLTWSETGSYLLGDSIGAYARAAVEERRPGWVVNAVHGRPVSELPLLVKNLRKVDKRPARVVIELGSNQVAGWSKADYEEAIRRLPASTRVLLVTPFKASWRWGRTAARTTAAYARWMNQIAARRPHTCVVPWRRAARSHPGWLRDGLHPKRAYFEKWADILVTADDACR
jgi:hypothetical protein